MSSRMLQKAQRYAIAISLLLLGMSRATAVPIVIDSFQTPQQVSADGMSHTVAAPETLGGTRTISLGLTGSSVTVSGGSLVYNEPILAGLLTVTYNGDNQGLGPIDVTAGGTTDRIEVAVAECSLAGRMRVRLITDPIRSYVSALHLEVQPADEPIVYSFPYSQFRPVTSTPATLASIWAIGVDFICDHDPGNSGQVVLSGVQITPEPASVVLLVMAGSLVVCGRLGRCV